MRRRCWSAPNTSATATYLPSHCVLAIACDPDTGWIDGPGRFAGAALPDGTVYGWHDGRATMKRTAAFRLLPRDWTARTALSAQGTPAYPVNTRWLSPSTSEPYQALPWSALDMLATAAGMQCGVTWGDFAEIFAAFPDFDFQVEQFVEAGDTVTVRWSAAATFAGPGSFMGVEPTGADSMHRSFAAGSPQRIERVATIADSLGAPTAMPIA